MQQSSGTGNSLHSKNTRGSSNNEGHHSSKPDSTAITLELGQHAHITPGATNRHGSAKHGGIDHHGNYDHHQEASGGGNKRAGGGFFGHSSGSGVDHSGGTAGGAQTENNFLNKTQVIQSSNERANRTNLHRSNRQHSHHRQQQQHATNAPTTAQYYEKTGQVQTKNGQNGVPEVKI